MRTVLLLLVLPAVLTLTLLSSCVARGTAARGWIVYNDHVSYQAVSQDHDACQLHVAYERTASFTDDEQAHNAEALAAFRDVAMSLSKTNYDPHQVQLSRAVSASGVLRITMTCLVRP